MRAPESRSTPAAPVVTYFLLNETTGRLKIGKSTRLQKRCRDLENAGGAALRLLGTVEADCEREWHTRLKAARVRGEWFTLTPDVAETLRTRFGWRIRSPREPAPRPRVSLADFRHDLEAQSGLGLRAPVDAFTLEETLLDLVHDDALEDDEDDEDDPIEPDEITAATQAVTWAAIGLILERLEAWRSHWIGWMAPPPDAGARLAWIDVWFVFWAPRGEQSRARLRRDMLCAAQYSDYDGVERLRLRPILVDAQTAELEALEPQELYSDVALMAYLQMQNGG